VKAGRASAPDRAWGHGGELPLRGRRGRV